MGGNWASRRMWAMKFTFSVSLAMNSWGQRAGCVRTAWPGAASRLLVEVSSHLYSGLSMFSLCSSPSPLSYFDPCSLPTAQLSSCPSPALVPFWADDTKGFPCKIDFMCETWSIFPTSVFWSLPIELIECFPSILLQYTSKITARQLFVRLAELICSIFVSICMRWCLLC